MGKDFKINNFDLIRIVTATMVLCNHSMHHLGLQVPGFYKPLLQFPRVPMFFMMSGYLLSASYERNPDLYTYFTNRVLRIFPALWTLVLLSIAVFAFMGANFLRWESIPWIICQFLGIIYTPGFMKDFGFGSYNGSLWTIMVELQFYLLLPLIYLVAKALHRKYFSRQANSNLPFLVLFLLSFVAALTIRVYFDGGYGASGAAKNLRYTILPHAFIFLTGILLQRWRLFKNSMIQGKGIYWVIGYLAFVYWVPGSDAKYMVKMILLGACTIAIAYSWPGIASKYLKNMDLSYGVFLYHGLIINLLVHFNRTGHYAYLLVVLSASYLLAYLSYRYIETPAMALAHKINRSGFLQNIGSKGFRYKTQTNRSKIVVLKRKEEQPIKRSAS